MSVACQSKPEALLLKVVGEEKNCLLLVTQDGVVQVMKMQPCEADKQEETK